MNAKDKEISQFTDDEAIIYQRGYRHGAEAEAELSFEAGTQEVVEWITKHSLASPKLLLDLKDWQAKLRVGQ